MNVWAKIENRWPRMLDAHKRSVNLPPDVAQAELPARLAAAYARIGEHAKAVQYFQEASSGLKKALTNSGTTAKIQQQFAARTLYAMGQLTARQRGLNADPKSYLKSLSIQQPYLLQSAEQAIKPDSQKAAEDLIFAYENLLKTGTHLNQRSRDRFWSWRCKISRRSSGSVCLVKGSLVDEIFDKVDVQESRVRQMLMAQAETTPLTG